MYHLSFQSNPSPACVENVMKSYSSLNSDEGYLLICVSHAIFQPVFSFVILSLKASSLFVCFLLLMRVIQRWWWTLAITGSSVMANAQPFLVVVWRSSQRGIMRRALWARCWRVISRWWAGYGCRRRCRWCWCGLPWNVVEAQSCNALLILKSRGE